jgi:hypothetical protein
MSDSGGSRHQCLLVSLFDRSRKVDNRGRQQGAGRQAAACLGHRVHWRSPPRLMPLAVGALAVPSTSCTRALLPRPMELGSKPRAMDNRRTTSMHAPLREPAPAGARRPPCLDAPRQARTTQELAGAHPPQAVLRRPARGHLPAGKPRGATGGRPPVGKERRERGSLPRFAVIPTECSVGGRRLMIICPYPFCDALEAARCERSA